MNDPAWMDAIDVGPADGTVLFVAGVFYSFTTKQVQRLVTSMAERFPGRRLVFDGAGKIAVKLMLKTWVKQAELKDIGVHFSVKDAKGEPERVGRCSFPFPAAGICRDTGSWRGRGKAHPPPSG